MIHPFSIDIGTCTCTCMYMYMYMYVCIVTYICITACLTVEVFVFSNRHYQCSMLGAHFALPCLWRGGGPSCEGVAQYSRAQGTDDRPRGADHQGNQQRIFQGNLKYCVIV